MRIGIIAFLHESNTFVSEATTIEHFRENTLLLGDDVRQMQKSHHEVAGFFEALAEVDSCEAVPRGPCRIDRVALQGNGPGRTDRRTPGSPAWSHGE